MASPMTLDHRSGDLTLHTGREGVASRVGHDLTLRVGRWSADLEVGADGRATSVRVVADLASLEVVRGDGGLKPLTDKDRRTILDNALETLDAARHPELVFEVDGLSVGEGRSTVDGTLALAGRTAPQSLDVVVASGGTSVTVTGEVVQSAFGIKPYSGMLGALKVRDAVELRAALTLP